MSKKGLIDITLEIRMDDDSKMAVAFWNGEYENLSNGDDWKEERWVWLPRSKIDYEPAKSAGDSRVYNVTMPEWLAKEKGLI